MADRSGFAPLRPAGAVPIGVLCGGGPLCILDDLSAQVCAIPSMMRLAPRGGSVISLNKY